MTVPSPHRLVAAAAAFLLLVNGAQATLYTYTAQLSGPDESPPNASPGTGSVVVTYDDVVHHLSIDAVFSDLVSTSTNAHIHAATAVPFTGTAGVATSVPSFPGFPSGVTSGTYFAVFDLTMASSFNPAYITAAGSIGAAELALATAMASGQAYFNLHSSQYPGGEIRGFLRPASVPDSASTILLLAVVLGCLTAWKLQLRTTTRTVNR